MTRKHTRRTFLRGAMAASALAPFATSFLARPARAATPTRALFVYVPDGCIPALWHPSGTETAFTLPSMSAPLEPVRNHLVFLDGLDMYAGGGTHEGGIAKVLTGAGDVSIDVHLGRTVGASAPHAAVHLGIATAFENGDKDMSYVGPNQREQREDNPLAAFDALFGTAMAGGDSDAEAAAKRRRAVLDAALFDLERLRRRTDGTEAQKLEIHQSSLEQVRSRVGGSTMACGNIAWNTEGFAINPNDHYPRTFHIVDHFATVGKLQTDLAVLALSCGLTQVVSLMWSHPVMEKPIPGVDSNGMTNHQASHYGSDPANPTALAFVRMKRWFSERFAELITKMAATPDGTGTLLDTTIVLFCSELGDGSTHDHRRVPFVLAGGGLRGNRYLNYQRTASGENQPHTKLLVSIARAMGDSIDRFGYVGHGTGGLDGLFG